MEMTPRAVGELLSDAVALMRRHMKAIFLIALPFCALEVLMREGGATLLAVARRGVDQGTPEEVLAALPYLGGGFLFWLGMSVVLQLLAAATTTLTAAVALGQPMTAQEATKSALRRVASILWTTLLFSLGLILFAAVLPALPVIALAFVTFNPIVLIGVYGSLAVVLAVVFFFRWVMWPQVLMLEGRSGLAALKRSKEMMAARADAGRFDLAASAKFRLSVLMLVFFVASGALQALFAIPTLLVSYSTSGVAELPPLIELPGWFIVPVVLVTVLTNSVVFPFSGVASTLFYFDLRVRHEGFGLSDDDSDDEEGEQGP